MSTFREARAESPATACSLEQVSIRDSWVFRRMVDRGVFVRTDGDRWYMDEQAVEEFLRGRRNRVLVMVAVAFVVVILVIVLNW